MGKLRPEGVIVGLGVLGGTLGVEVGTKEIAICSEGEYSIVCTCFGSLCDSSPGGRTFYCPAIKLAPSNHQQ